MQYYGTRLSENISRREPEGYLFCLNVPVARTCTQEYLPGEIGLGAAECRSGRGDPLCGKPELISVFRPEEEVFAPATVASFEGMPLTDGHPPEGVDVSNIRAFQKGHAHNVRRGSGEESDLLLADLIITDPALITAVLEEGKREISCGYTYELCRENGQYIQRKSRGNHVAVVDAGRAGHRVSIRDGYPSGISEPVNERRARIMKKSLSKVLARMAKDGDPETVARIIEEMLDPEETGAEKPVLPEEAAEEQPGETEENTETTNIIIDEDGLAGILERLDRIIALLEPAAADESAEEEITGAIGEAMEEAARASEDPAAEEVAAVMEEILDPVASVILDPEEENRELPETMETGDALRAALTAVSPVLARMPLSQRRRIAGDIAGRLRRTADAGGKGSDIYGVLASAQRRMDRAPSDLGRRIMEKRNASYKKGKE